MSERNFSSLPYYEVLAQQAEAHIAEHGLKDFDKKDVFAGLSISELSQLVEHMAQTANLEEAYALMALPTQDGKSTYYDRLFGPQHKIAYEGFRKVLARTEIAGSKRAAVAMDVGAGTGENTITLMRLAQKVIAADLSKPMLEVAKHKTDAVNVKAKFPTEVEYRVADVFKLEVEPASVDFIIDNGFLTYLSPMEIHLYWQKVSEWLKPKGRYYTFDKAQPKVGFFDTTLRAQLAGLSVELLLQLSHQMGQFSYPPRYEAAEEYGFAGWKLHRLQEKPFKAGVVQWTKN